MNEAVSSTLQAYGVIEAQVKELKQQQTTLAEIIFDDVRRRISLAPNVNVPDEFVFTDPNNAPPKGEWNQARWDLTELYVNLRMAYEIVSAPLDEKFVELLEDGSLVLGGTMVERQMSGRAKVPAWVLDAEPQDVANTLAQKVQAAELEKYPQM